jgi:adenylate cyclase
VLEGSVQQEGDRIRVTAQLIDAITGRHLWADRYERELREIFAIQDDITQHIVTETAVKLAEGENERILGHGTNNLEAWTSYRKGETEFRKFTKESNSKARELVEKAIELDPNYGDAYAFLGWTYAWPVRAGISKAPAENLQKAEELVEKAFALNPDNANAQNLLGFIYGIRGDYDRAIKEGNRAVEMAPNMPDAHALLAEKLLWAGQYEEAIAGHRQAMRLGVFYPDYIPRNLGIACFGAGLYKEALAGFEEALERRRGNETYLTWKATTYQALGRGEEAKAVVEKVLRIKPNYCLEDWRKRFLGQFRDQSAVDRILSYARQAGLPEKSPQSGAEVK